MGVEHLAWLWILPLVGGGVVLIHMVRRRYSRNRVFGPAFLIAQDPPTVRPSRDITDKWQMIFRLLAIAMAVLALAGPYRSEETVAGSVEAVLIDASLSMTQTDFNGSSRLVLAEQKARSIGSAGAQVFYCADRLRDKIDQILPGRANLARCRRDLHGRGIRSGIVLLTDGQGSEQMDRATLAGVAIDIIRPASPRKPRQRSVVLRQENQRWMLDNKSGFGLQVGGDHALTCADGVSCVVSGRKHKQYLTVQARLSGLPLSWRIPFGGGRLKVQFVADYVSRDPFGAARLWQESLSALSRRERIDFSVLRDPGQAQAADLVIYLWEDRQQTHWKNWLEARPPQSTLWVVPGPQLPDSIEPQPIVGAFGSYRGWLQETHRLELPAISAVAVTHTISRVISVAETQRAVVVLRDTGQYPLLLFAKRPKPALLWTFSPVDQGKGLALTPDFVPFVDDLLNKYVIANHHANRCVAGAGTCPYFSDGSIFPQPDWQELAPRFWQQKLQQDRKSSTQKISLAPWFIFAGLLFLAISIPPWSAILPLLFLLSGLAQADSLVVAWPGGKGVGIDAARLQAFSQLADQLAIRGNIRLAYPVALTSGVKPVLLWSNFCGVSTDAIGRILQAAQPWVNRQVPWWVEDCSPPGEPSPGWLLLREFAGTSMSSGGWQRVPSRHVLFRSYYLLNKLAGRFSGGSEKALIEGGMPQVLYMPQDLTGKAAFRGLRENVIRSFVNVIFYLTMGNYKDDGIHVPYLMKRLKRLDRK